MSRTYKHQRRGCTGCTYCSQDRKRASKKSVADQAVTTYYQEEAVSDETKDLLAQAKVGYILI